MGKNLERKSSAKSKSNPLNWDSNDNFCKKKYGDPSQFLEQIRSSLKSTKDFT
jgi:hypothetical protein